MRRSSPKRRRVVIMKDKGGAQYPSDYFFCLPVHCSVFTSQYDFWHLLFKVKSQEAWGWDNKKWLGARYSTDYFLCLPVFAIWFFIFIFQSPKFSVHVSTCYQWRLDYRIGAQLIRNGKTKVSSEPTWSRAAKSCVHGKFPSSLKRFHMFTIPPW